MDVATAILSDRGEEEIVLVGRPSDEVARKLKATELTKRALSNPFAKQRSDSGNNEALVDLGEGERNPFKGGFSGRGDRIARDKMYNTINEVRSRGDFDPSGRSYPAKPTPSQWFE